MYKKILTTFFIYIFSGLTFLLADGLPDQPEIQSFTPNKKPDLNIPFLTDKIEVDGNLDEQLWTQAAIADNFVETQPGDLTKPQVNTEVRIAYNKEFLYVAFICEDDPDKVRASLRDRDEIWSDDYVGVLVDTYGNSNWAYFLFSNAFGVQGDTRYSTSGGEDDRFDMIYFSSGKITDTGFQVEMAIPFSSMRFPDNDVQNWRINFWRNHPRENRYKYSWTTINRDDPCFLCQYGQAQGIEDIEPGSSFEVLPSFVGNQSGQISDFDNPNSKFIDEDIKGELGVSVKWAATPSLTVEGSINPDFSQVESDASKIDVNNTFALSFPEKRPFFQEGSDLFRTWHKIVYTRSINDPIAAAKIIGRWDKTTFALLSAFDENTPIILPFEERSRFVAMENSASNILRFKHEYGENNFIGALISDRRLEGEGSITNYSFDAMYRFFNNYIIEFQAVGSHNKEPNDSTLTSSFNNVSFANGKHTAGFNAETITGDAIYTGIERNARNWDFNIKYWQTSPTFRTGNGLVTQNNNRQVSFNTGYTFYFDDNPIIKRIRPIFNTARHWNYNGTVKDEWIVPGLFMNLQGQINTEIGYVFNNELFSGTKFNGINRIHWWLESRFSEMVSVGFFYRNGNYIDRRNLEKGHGTQAFELWGTIKPLNNFIIQPNITYAELIRNSDNKFSFKGAIYRVKANYQFTRELFLRLVLQYNEFNNDFAFEPLLSYKVNPFTIFYLGMSSDKQNYNNGSMLDVLDWETTSRQFFMKFQYLFSI